MPAWLGSPPGFTRFLILGLAASLLNLSPALAGDRFIVIGFDGVLTAYPAK